MLKRVTIAALFVLQMPHSGIAADGAWMTKRFNVVIRDQDVADVFREFGGLAGVPVVVSEAVDARATARFENATGEQIIEALAGEYGLDWRYDGRRIEVSSNTEQVGRILDMGGVRRGDLVTALEALDSYEPRFPISALDGELAMIVAPPRYVAIVEVVLAELVEKRRESLALAEAERLAAEAERLAAEERARAALRNRPRPVSDTPLINRGGRWGG